MKPIALGFKAFDAHELLCHFVAERAGLYRYERLKVELADITFTPDDELPEDRYQASCGAALASAVRGSGQTVVLVAVDRPMFWLWSHSPLHGVAGLAGRRLATFPPVAPPHGLANAVLIGAGLEPGRDVRLLPARDDVARLGLLRSDSADAAVVSSAVPPARMAALGFHCLCFIGDQLRVPTTGLAVHQSRLRAAPQEVETLVGIHREALRRIHADPELTAAVLRDTFDVDAAIAGATAQLFATAFTADGRTSSAIAQAAVETVSQSLGVADPPGWDQVYRF